MSVPEETHPVYTGKVRIIYPADGADLILRTEDDWDRDIEPVHSEGGDHFEFELGSERPFLHFKPCRRAGDSFDWASGPNRLVFLGLEVPQSFYPHFAEVNRGEITDIASPRSAILEREHRLRVYLPPGYHDNPLKRYPVIYMQDGGNVFFPEEAFLGRDWAMTQTADLCARMNLIDQTLIVGVFAEDRMHDYSKPGYEAYGKALVTEVKPYVDRSYRTLPGVRHTMAMGSSMGGVVSFYLAWEWPSVFGNAACMSSSFSYDDDLLERVRWDDVEPRKSLGFYLDSGWPRDNYEATLRMTVALLGRGFEIGKSVVHFAFPGARHDEVAWAERAHLPLQAFSGRIRRAAELAGSRMRRA